MNSILFAVFLAVAAQSQASAISAPTTESVAITQAPNGSSLDTTTTKGMTTQPLVPKEFLFGFQRWGEHGNVALGFSEGIHELRLLGPNTGLYLDYKATLLHIKALRFNAGGMIGVPSILEGHIGAQYRTGGDSCWGRVAIGLDGGVSCSRIEDAYECDPAGGFNIGIYFLPSDFSF